MKQVALLHRTEGACDNITLRAMSVVDSSSTRKEALSVFFWTEDNEEIDVQVGGCVARSETVNFDYMVLVRSSSACAIPAGISDWLKYFAL